MSLLAASLDLCVGYNSSGNISGDFCKLAGGLLSVDPGVKLRERCTPEQNLYFMGKNRKFCV